MKKIVQVQLDNEMDLILAHKRVMKLAELTGFSVINQTTFATAVSEVARCAIEYGHAAALVLGIEAVSTRKYLKAVICDTVDFTIRSGEACSYAGKLVDDIETIRNPKDIQIALKQQLNFAGTLTDSKIDSFIEYFRKEPPLSAYDELRRKNLLLQDLAEKVKESENDYRLLTDSLPLMMFSVNVRGQINYTNQWLKDFLGPIPKELNSAAWKNNLHPADGNGFVKDITNTLHHHIPLQGKYRFKEKSTGEFLWHLVSVIPLKNERDIVHRWIGFIVDIDAEVRVEQTLRDNQELKQMQKQLFEHQEELQQKIVELNRSNYELEQFAHLASHDLQEPLRKLFFYSDVLKKKYGDVIDSAGSTMLNNMTLAAARMKELINDLLSYSQLQQQKLTFEPVDLNKVLDDIVKELDLVIREKNAVIEIANMPIIQGNAIRLHQLFMNVISNALKYSKKDVPPEIKVTVVPEDDQVVISVKDNGIGFEEEHSERIFGLFERLHARDKFPGTGIGLSICKKITELHHGSISARSIPNEYAVFEIALPVKKEESILTA